MRMYLSKCALLCAVLAFLCSEGIAGEGTHRPAHTPKAPVETALKAPVETTLGLIPWPTELRCTAGEFILTDKTKLVAPPERSQEALQLAMPLRRATGFPLPIIVSTQGKCEDGCIVLCSDAGRELGAEAYELTVTAEKIVITAGTAAGHFYGTRTLLQLLPPQAAAGHRAEAGKPVRWAVSGIEIKDSPRFTWRAFMLDESRHFHGLTTVKRYIDEMLDLFPDAVIHTGGDEVSYVTWETAPSIQAAMSARGLTNSAPLQAEFTAKLATYIAGKGRRMMYWADALEQIPPEKSVILQFWQGDPALITKAVSRGYDLVNSFQVSTYLDYNYASLPLKKAYSLEPVPLGLTPEQQKRIVGLGAQTWGEFIPTRFRCDQQTFPRLAALAEVAWTPPDQKDYRRFVSCLTAQERRWDLAGIQYARGRAQTVEEDWKEVLSGEKVGCWTPSQVGLLGVKSRYRAYPAHDYRLDVSSFIRGPGRYRIGFAVTDGAHSLHVRLVELSENGQAVACDWGGFSGASYAVGKYSDDSYVFDLVVPDVRTGASYELRMNWFALKISNTSGEIFIKNTGDLQPVYHEGPASERVVMNRRKER
ncbi:MAG: family 20 glycosylhydrolase [Kiritimatiellia bacterium]